MVNEYLHFPCPLLHLSTSITQIRPLLYQFVDFKGVYHCSASEEDGVYILQRSDIPSRMKFIMCCNHLKFTKYTNNFPKIKIKLPTKINPELTQIQNY